MLSKSNKVNTACLFDMQQWMNNLPVHVKELPLIFLKIPGSHNSLSYSISSKSDISPDAPSLVQRLSRLSKSIVNRVVYSWSRTQSIDVADQLQAGVRYLDIRLASRNSQIYVVHGLYGGLINNMLEVVKSFLVLNNKEVIILDFQHFYNFKTQDHSNLLDVIEKLFSSMICPSDCGNISDISLQKMQSSEQQILILYRSRAITSRLFWPSQCWPTPWPNTVRVNDLIDYLNTELKQRKLNKGLVTQCLLTVDVKYIVLHIFSNLQRLANATNPRIFLWVENQNNVNVVISDFVQNYNFIGRIIMLNYKHARLDGS